MHVQEGQQHLACELEADGGDDRGDAEDRDE